MVVDEDIETPPTPRVIRQKGRMYLRVSKRWLIALAILWAGPLAWMVVANGGRFVPTITATPLPQQMLATTADRAMARPATTSPITTGPWGELELIPITLEPPADFAAKLLKYDSTTWYFRDCDMGSLPHVLRSCGINEVLIPDIVKTATAHPAINGLTVKPETHVMLGLSDDAKEKLYAYLAGSDGNNYSKIDPFRFRPLLLDRRFALGDISDESARLIRRLAYRRGELLLFSDVSVVLESVSTEAEKVKILRSLAAQFGQHARLHVQPGSDVIALAKYWGGGSSTRARELLPVLESLSKVPGGAEIDIAKLLPPFARVRLHEYPEEVGDTPNNRLDCHWTSMNFWNSTPDDRYSDPVYVANKLSEEYVPATGDLQFGDVMFLTRGGSQAIHSAVYLAGDLFFTKNGGTITTPWMLMRKDDMLTYYSIHGPVQVMVYRKKSI